MITLRAIEKTDLELIKRWRNSPCVMPYCRQYRPLSSSDMLDWYDSLTNDKEYNLVNDLFVIEWEGLPVGVGGFVRIDWRNRKAEVSFYVGEDTKRIPSIVNKALMAIVEYGFKTLSLWKVYFPVYQKSHSAPNLIPHFRFYPVFPYGKISTHARSGDYRDWLIIHR